jgi:hypothetical protein
MPIESSWRNCFQNNADKSFVLNPRLSAFIAAGNLAAFFSILLASPVWKRVDPAFRRVLDQV